MRLAAEVAHPAVESLEKYQKLISELPQQGRPALVRRNPAECQNPAKLSWIEAVALALELEQLDEDEAETVRRRATDYRPDDNCPLFGEEGCLLEQGRALSCRLRDPWPEVQDAGYFKWELESINRQFVSEVFHSLSSEKTQLTVAEALLLDV